MHGGNSIFSEATEVYIQFLSLKCIELVCSDSEAWHILYLVQDNADVCDNNPYKFYMTRPECTNQDWQYDHVTTQAYIFHLNL